MEADFESYGDRFNGHTLVEEDELLQSLIEDASYAMYQVCNYCVLKYLFPEEFDTKNFKKESRDEEQTKTEER